MSLLHADIEPMDWESHFFSLSTAKLVDIGDESKSIIDFNDLANYQRLQAKVNAVRYDLVDLLSQNGFSFIEGEVSLTFPSEVIAHFSQQVFYHQAENSDLPVLQKIASSAFQLSRFRAPWYKPDDNARFYSIWVEKAVLGLFDDYCLIIKDKSGIAQGFITLKHHTHNEARIGLVAVAEYARNKGIGSQLIQAALRRCSENSIKQLHVTTQIANILALRLYSKLGAIIADTNYWLYR